jgi:hypothetical protein
VKEIRRGVRELAIGLEGELNLLHGPAKESPFHSGHRGADLTP